MSELTKALCEFHKEVGVITKAAKAQYGAFADLAGVLSTVIPPLAKNGLAITQTFVPSEGFEPVLVTTLRHVSGEAIESHLPMVVNKGRNALHDWGSSCTYLRRYALLSALCLVADVDTDGAFVEEAPQPKSTTKKETPKATKSKPLGDQPLTATERDEILLVLAARHKQRPEDLADLQQKFNAKFKLDAGAKLSLSITTQEHVEFINQTLKPL